MYRYLAAFMLAFSLMFGLSATAYASSEDTSSAGTFNWYAVATKAIGGIALVTPALVYFTLNNKKDK